MAETGSWAGEAPGSPPSYGLPHLAPFSLASSRAPRNTWGFSPLMLQTLPGTWGLVLSRTGYSDHFLREAKCHC